MKIYKDLNYNINYNDIDDVLKLLRGIYHLPISQYDYSEPLPTATDKVMRQYIYYNHSNKNLKEIFQNALITMLNSSAADVFLVVEYFVCCLYYENIQKATFVIDREVLLPMIRQAIQKNMQELSNAIVFVDGTINKQPLNRLNVLNNVYKREYNFAIL